MFLYYGPQNYNVMSIEDFKSWTSFKGVFNSFLFWLLLCIIYGPALENYPEDLSYTDRKYLTQYP